MVKEAHVLALCKENVFGSGGIALCILQPWCQLEVHVEVDTPTEQKLGGFLLFIYLGKFVLIYFKRLYL